MGPLKSAGSLSAAAFISVMLCPAAASAQDVAAFYKGKTIQIICGFAPGGGYDLYPRVLARHMGRHIPGQPNIVVQNMVGASSVRASNHVYAIAPRDGTTIAAVNQNMPMYSLLGGKSAQFDARRFAWLGTMASSNGVLFTYTTSQTKTLADAVRRETLLGGVGTNSDSHIFPTLINKLLNTKFKVINGYGGGTSEINLAIERGEVEGRGGNTWASLQSTNAIWINNKKLNYVVQIGLEKEPDLGATPLLSDLVTSDDDRKAVEVISLPTAIGYAHWMAPGIPADRFSALRKAYMDALKDPLLLQEAEKLQLLITPKSGEEIEKLMDRAFATPQPVLDRTAQLLEWTGQ